VFDSVVLGREGNNAVERSLEHARWFAEEHYAPFPASFDAALERFCRRLDVEAVVRLSPIFFRTRAYELEHPDFAFRSFGARFSSSFRPPVGDTSAELQAGLLHQLEQL
jgi:hypothetical protein